MPVCPRSRGYVFPVVLLVVVVVWSSFEGTPLDGYRVTAGTSHTFVSGIDNKRAKVRKNITGMAVEYGIHQVLN